MLQAILSIFKGSSQELDVWKMGVRAVVVYVVVVAIVRLGQRRFMGKNAPFDVILGIMLGSVVSRAITGNAPFVPSLAAAVVLMAVHWLFSVAAFHWHGFGELIKGKPEPLFEDGAIHWPAMQRNAITEHDLNEALHIRGRVPDLSKVSTVYLERNGDLSVLPAPKEPKVLDVAVADGVATVRIKLE